MGFGLGLATIVCRYAAPVWRSIGIPGRFMLLFALLSSASVTSAFLVTRYAYLTGGLAAARYLLNLYYMVFVAGIIVVGAAWTQLGWQKLIVAGWLALFAVPGVLAEWRNFEYHGLENEALIVNRELIANLRSAGLTNGFAPYYSGGVGANSLTYLGQDELTVRLVEIIDGRSFGHSIRTSIDNGMPRATPRIFWSSIARTKARITPQRSAASVLLIARSASETTSFGSGWTI